jgi:hypothetical protein
MGFFSSIVFETKILKLKMRLANFLSVVFLSTSVIGCVQVGESAVGYKRDDDCLFCHARTNNIGTKALERIYADRAKHHPVDIEYPPTSVIAKEFNEPNAQRGEIAFFDTNADGRLDSEDIRLYPEKSKMIISCATCHCEHDKSPQVVEHPDSDHLRGTNVDGELCMSCHRKQPKPLQYH